MTLSLPKVKNLKIQQQWKKILSQPLTSIRTLSQLIGNCSTAIQDFARQANSSNSRNIIKEFYGVKSDSLRISKKGAKMVDLKCKYIQQKMPRAKYGELLIKRREVISNKRARTEAAKMATMSFTMSQKLGI